MHVKINEKVSVILVFSARKGLSLPYRISWQNKDYSMAKIGYHHTINEGRDLHHIFELTVKESDLWMRLNYNTRNLQWTLEAVSDGNAN